MCRVGGVEKCGRRCASPPSHLFPVSFPVRDVAAHWRLQLCSLRRVRALHQPPVAGGRHTRAHTRQVLTGTRSPSRMAFSLPRQYETGLPVLPRGACYKSASMLTLTFHQDLFTSTRSSTTLPCGHNVHVHCFHQYARAQPWTRCPLCRKTSMYATTPPSESPPAPHTLREHVARSSARHVIVHRPRNRQVCLRLCSCRLLADRWISPPTPSPTPAGRRCRAKLRTCSPGVWLRAATTAKQSARCLARVTRPHFFICEQRK